MQVALITGICLILTFYYQRVRTFEIMYDICLIVLLLKPNLMTKVIAVVSATKADMESVDKNLIFNRIGDLRKKLSSLEDIDVIQLATPDIELISFAEANDWTHCHTYQSHVSTTGHCAQAAKKFWPSDIILDIPLYFDEKDLKCLETLITKMLDDNWMQIACVRKKMVNTEGFSDTEVIKVVTDRFNRVLYLSRATIPYHRTEKPGAGTWYEYFPLHAFRNKSLQEIAELQPSPLESAEQIEALRWLENNYMMYAFGE